MRFWRAREEKWRFLNKELLREERIRSGKSMLWRESPKWSLLLVGISQALALSGTLLQQKEHWESWAALDFALMCGGLGFWLKISWEIRAHKKEEAEKFASRVTRDDCGRLSPKEEKRLSGLERVYWDALKKTHFAGECRAEREEKELGAELSRVKPAVAERGSKRI